MDALIENSKEAPRASASSSMLAQFLHYRLLLQHGWWIVALSVSVALCIAAWLVFQMPPQYRSVGRMMVSGKLSLPEGSIYSEESGNFFGTQIELMQSPSVRKRAAAGVNRLNPDLKPSPVTLGVGQQPRTSIFTLTAIGDEPGYAQAYLAAVMQEYVEMKKEMRSQKSDVTLSAITEQLKALDKSLQDYETELQAFAKNNNIDYLQQGGNSAGTYLVGLEQKVAGLKTEHELLTRLDLDQNLQRHQNSPTGGTANAEPVLQSFGPQGDYMRVNQQVQLLRARLQEFSQYLRPKHPIIAQLNNEISLQEKLLGIFRVQSKSQLATQKESVRIQIENIEAQIAEWRVKALDLSSRMAQYEKLKGRLDRAKNMYDRLLTSMQAVDVNRNIDQDTVSILESATTAYPVKPGIPKTVGIALGLGLLVGVAIVLIRDQLDDRLKSISVFQSHFTGRIMGQVAKESTKGPLSLLEPEDSRHLFAEAFSNMRSALFFLPYEGARPKTLLVTSAIPNEGKSTVTSNLALTLAAGGARTLLVDADLRRGQLGDKFQIKRAGACGFSEILTGECKLADAVAATKISNLFLLPRGKVLSQPSRYLLGNIMDQFLKEVYDQYDFIVFDTCPILVADDTTSFAPKIDATLFVVRVGQSSIRSSRKALELLANRQANVLGFVLNAVDNWASGYDYYKYYDYYHKEDRKAS